MVEVILSMVILSTVRRTQGRCVMAIEALISLVTLVVIASRAINVLAT